MRDLGLAIIFILILSPLTQASVSYVDTVHIPNDSSDCYTNDGSVVTTGTVVQVDYNTFKQRGYVRFLLPNVWFTPGGMIHDSTLLWVDSPEATAESLNIFALDTTDCPVFEGGWNPYGSALTGYNVKWEPSEIGTLTIEIDSVLQYWKNTVGASQGSYVGLEVRMMHAGDDIFTFDDVQQTGDNEARLIFYFQGDSVKNCYWYADTVLGYAPATIQFTDTSDGTPSGWLWDFGDGHTSSQQNPSHTYQNPGIYTVSLMAWDVWNDTVSLEKEKWIAISGAGMYYIRILQDADDAYLDITTEVITGTVSKWGKTVVGPPGLGHAPYMRFFIDSTTIATGMDSVFLWAKTVNTADSVELAKIENIDSADCGVIEGADFSEWTIQTDSVVSYYTAGSTPWASTGWKQHPDMVGLYKNWDTLDGSSDRYWGIRLYGDKGTDGDVEAELSQYSNSVGGTYLQCYLSDLPDDFTFAVMESLNNLVKFKIDYLATLEGASIRYSLIGYPGKAGGTVGDTAISPDDTIMVVKGLLSDTTYYFSLIAHTEYGSWVKDSLTCTTLPIGNWPDGYSQDVTIAYTGSDTLVNWVAEILLRPSGISDMMFNAGTRLARGWYYSGGGVTRSYYAYVTSTESLNVGYYDHSDHYFHGPWTVMEARGQMHGAPSICADGDGYVHIFSGGHGGMDYIHYWRSKHPNPYELASDSLVNFWNDDSNTITGWNDIKGTYPWSSIAPDSDVTIYLRTTGALGNWWMLFSSANKGTTFTPDTIIQNLTSGYVYSNPIEWANDSLGILLWDEGAINGVRQGAHALVTLDSGNTWQLLTDLSDTVDLPVADSNSTSLVFNSSLTRQWSKDQCIFDDSLNPIIFVKETNVKSNADSSVWHRLWYHNFTTCDTDTVWVGRAEGIGFRIIANSLDSIWEGIFAKDDWAEPRNKRIWPHYEGGSNSVYGMACHHYWFYESLDSGKTWTATQNLERTMGLNSPYPLGLISTKGIGGDPPADAAIRSMWNWGWGKNTRLNFYPIAFSLSTENIFSYSLCRYDGGDLRVKDESDNNVPYYLIWEYQGTSRLYFVMDSLKGADTLTYKLVFGNQNAGDASWPESVFTSWLRFPEWNMSSTAKKKAVIGGTPFVNGELVETFSQLEDTASAWVGIDNGIVTGWVFDVPHTESDSCGHDFVVSVAKDSSYADTFSLRFWMKNEPNPHFHIQDTSQTVTITDAGGVEIYPIEPFTGGWHNVKFYPNGKFVFDDYHTYYMKADTFRSIKIGRWDPLTLDIPHETYYHGFGVSPFYTSDSLVTVSLGSPPLVGYWIYNTGEQFTPQGDDINVTTNGNWLVLESTADTGVFYTEIEDAEWALDPTDTNAQGKPNKTADLHEISWDDSIPSGASTSYYVAASDDQEDLTEPNSISWTLVSNSEDDPDLKGIYQRGKIILRPSGGNGPIVYWFRGDYTLENKFIESWLVKRRHGQFFQDGRERAIKHP